MKKIIYIILASVLHIIGNAQVCFDPATNYTVSGRANIYQGTRPQAITSADFNGDGLNDLAVAVGDQASSGDNSVVSVLLGIGAGIFGSASSFSLSIASSYPYAIINGDFNGDGKVDLATADNNGSGISVTVLLGLGNGSFFLMPTYTLNTGTQMQSLTSADFNGDGKLDLCAVYYGANLAYVSFGTGTGSFGSATTYTVGTGPNEVTSADFNGDNAPDIAVANRGASNISILLNTGMGGFGAMTNFITGSHPYSLTCKDFNSDGFMDIATANFGSNNVSVLLGTGSGSFGAATNYSVAIQPMSVRSADFNGDNKLDLCVANGGSNNVSILLGTGTGSFGTATNYSVGTLPESIIGIDLNGDAKADIATSNFSSNNVSVLLNAPTVSVSSTQSICAGNTATLTASGAYSYTWSTSQSVASIGVTPSVTTNYTVTGKNIYGTCANTATTSIVVNLLPSVIVNSGAICPGQSFTMAPSGANTYTYSGGSAVVTPTTTNSYSVTGTSAAGCTSSNAAISTITVNPLPIVTVNSGSVCSGQSFTMAPSGANTYTYSGGSAVVTPTTTNSYSVTGTSAAGCISSNAAISTITVSPLPIVTVNSGSICSGQSFTMAPSGANTYTYSGGSAVVAPTTTSSYSVTGTSAAGCTSSNAAISTITVNPLPIVTVNSGSVCSGQSFTMAPSGANTYTFSNGSAVVTPTTTSSYSVTGTSAAGCTSSNAAISTITVNSLPIVTVNSGSICSGQSFTMAPSGASTYTYSGGSAVVTPTANSTYSITGTNINGCVNNPPALSTVTVNSTPSQPVAIIGNQYLCVSSINNYSITPVSGATSYSWFYPSGWSGTSITNTINTVSGGASGNISVTANNICGNSSAQTLPITVFNLPNVTASASSDSICNGNNTTLTGNGANTYMWNDGNTNNSELVSPTVNTTYTVTGTDVNNCVSTATVMVVVNQLPTLTYNQNPNSVCITHSPFTLSTGFPTGGTYSGLGVTGNTFNPLVADTGTIIIVYSYTDIHGCSNTKTQNIIVSNCTSTGINQYTSNSEQLSIYPNPASTSLLVSVKQLTSNGCLQITDILGNVLIKNDELKMQNSRVQIDISNLQSGVYFIRIGNAIQRFVKE